MHVELGLNLLFKMALPQIIISRFFSKELNCNIPVEVIHGLSKFKFNGEGESTFREHLLQVLRICFCHGMGSKYVMARLLTLTF